MHRILLCIAVLTTACGAAAAPSPTGPTTLRANATMLRVVDGDTIDVTVERPS